MPWPKGKKQSPEMIAKRVLHPNTLSPERGKKISANSSHFWLGKKRPNLILSQTFKKGVTPWNKGKPHIKIQGEKHHNWKGGKPKCEDCSKQLSAYQAKKCINCHVKIRFGENNPSWKGGVTPVNKKIRHSKEMRLWRETVFLRDDWTCVFCGIKSAKGVKVILNADHIKPFALFPELRFDVNNGRTLCEKCHKTTDTYGGRFRKSIGVPYESTNSRNGQKLLT